MAKGKSVAKPKASLKSIKEDKVLEQSEEETSESDIELLESDNEAIDDPLSDSRSDSDEEHYEKSNEDIINSISIASGMKKELLSHTELPKNLLYELCYLSLSEVKTFLSDPDLTLYKIIDKSELYKPFTKQNFDQLTEGIRYEVKGTGLYPCPICKSTKTNTVTQQLRSSDEPSTDKNTCLTCGYKWSVNS